MKRTEGSCWRCGKPANLIKRNAERGRLTDYAGKTVFEHLTCADLASKIPIILRKAK